MNKFIITDTIAAYITYHYEVEAENETEAKRLYQEGNVISIGYEEIGDSIDYVPQQLSIKKVQV